MPAAASLANLRPPWQPGEAGNAGSHARGYRKVLNRARLHSLEAVDTAVRLMRDPETPPATRLNAALAIIDRAWGKAEQSLALDSTGIATLRIEFVSNETKPAPTIDAQPETFEISFAAPEEPSE